MGDPYQFPISTALREKDVVPATAGQIGYLNIGYDAVDGTSNLNANWGGYTNTTSIASAQSAKVSTVPGKHYFAMVQFGSSGTTYAAMAMKGGLQA